MLTHKQLLKLVWGRPYDDQPHYLHVFMNQLRRKIEPDPARPRHLLTEPGVGYRLSAEWPLEARTELMLSRGSGLCYPAIGEARN